MECSGCGSQDTKMVSGVSKKTGKPWKAYDCSDCKNEKGYPTRTFVPSWKQNLGKQPSVTFSQNNSVDKKLDMILAILKKQFGEVSVEKKEEEPDELPF